MVDSLAYLATLDDDMDDEKSHVQVPAHSVSCNGPASNSLAITSRFTSGN